jgi:putative ABC transport system permease protein
MTGAAFLAFSHARHHAGRTVLLVGCLFVATLLPMGARVVLSDFQTRLLARAATTPMLAGAKGSRFDLVMAALYFRRAEVGAMTMKDWRTLSDSGLAEAIPMNVRFTARGLPIVAITPEYFELRWLRPATGSLPARIGEVVLGAGAARSLGLGAGDSLFSDQRELYDIAKPAALKMSIVGVLASVGTPDDHAVFTDIKTAWILEGASHGHAAAAKAIPDALVLERTRDKVIVSEEMVDTNEVTAANVSTFHIHGDPEALPITAVVLVPRSEKDLSILKARANAGKDIQVVVPQQAVEEMLGYVARLRQLLDVVSVLGAGFALVLIGLVTTLSVRVRAKEIQTLSRIGAGRASIIAIFAWEIGLMIVVAAALATLVAFTLHQHPPDLVKLL